MGLLDMFNGAGEKLGGLLGRLDEPGTNRALMAAANAMLEAGAPSRVPVTTMQALSRGMLAGQDAYRAHQEDEYARQERSDISAYRRAQTGAMEAKRKKEAELQDFIMSRLGGRKPLDQMSASGDVPGQASNPFNPGAAPAPGGMPMGAPGQAPQTVGTGSAGAPGMPQGGQAFPFNLQEVAMLKLRGIDLSDVYDMATKPLEMKAGNTYLNRATGERTHLPELPKGLTYDQRGNVAVAPGYMAANGQLQRQEADITEGAKASYDPVYGENERGDKTLLGSRYDVLRGGRGTAQGTRGAGPQPGMVIGRSESQKTYDTEMAKSYAETYKGINNAALKAGGQIAELKKIGQLLDDHDGGKFSSSALALAKAANSLGIKIDPNLGSKEAAQAISSRISLSLRDPSGGAGMPGAMSDADRRFLESMAPNIEQSKEGRTMLINAGIRVQERHVIVQRMAAKYQKRYGRIDDGFFNQLSQWSERNPLFGEQE